MVDYESFEIKELRKRFGVGVCGEQGKSSAKICNLALVQSKDFKAALFGFDSG